MVVIAVAEPVPAARGIDLEQIRLLLRGEVRARDRVRLRVEDDDIVAVGPLVEADVLVEHVAQKLGGLHWRTRRDVRWVAACNATRRYEFLLPCTRVN